MRREHDWKTCGLCQFFLWLCATAAVGYAYHLAANFLANYF